MRLWDVAAGKERHRIEGDALGHQPHVPSVAFAPDSLDVLDPAILSVVPGSLAPAIVSAGQTRPLFLSLRNDVTAQREIRRYAAAVEQLFGESMPITHAAFVANDRRAP